MTLEVVLQLPHAHAYTYMKMHTYEKIDFLFQLLHKFKFLLAQE